MKKRIDQWIVSILFFVFLLGMLLLYLCLPKQDFSQQEKRYLAEAPSFCWENLYSGKFFEDMETYMADHVPGRNFFVGLNAYYNLLTGRQAEILLTKDNRLVEEPVQGDSLIVERNMNLIHQFAEMIDVPVHLMIIPSSGWASEDCILGVADAYQDEELIEEIYGMAGDTVQTIDIVSSFAETGQPKKLYYKTDHHWNSMGAYTAYKVYMEFLGKPYRAQEDYQVETVPDFYGSTYSRSALWKTPGDSMELWHGSDQISVISEGSETVHEGVFFMERLEGSDKYTVFLDGNHALVRIDNSSCTGKGKLLVVRDSFSNCLGGFLAESYESVVLADLRYYKKPISELLKGETFDQILICYSLKNFLTDGNIVWLR